MFTILLTLQLALAQDVPVATTQVGPQEAEAQALLSVAQRYIDSGEIALARAMLEDLLVSYGETSVAADARAALAPLVTTEETSRATEGRVQLAISQGLIGGLTTGVLIPLTCELEGSDATPYVVSSLAGIGLGVGGSYLFTRNHTVDRGQAWTFALGEGLGLYHGILIATLPDDVSGAAVGGTMLLTETLGGLAGAWIAAERTPSAQDISLVTSGASWGAFNSLLVLAMVEPEAGSVFPLQVAITDVGLVTGLLLARRYDLSPRRLSLINGAGAAGAVVGTLLALTMDDSVSVGSTILLGEAAGLTLGAMSTRSMQREYDGQISWSAPQLKVIPERGGGHSVEVSLLNGQF